MNAVTKLSILALAAASPALAAPSPVLSPAQADAATHHGALRRGGQLPASAGNALAQGFNSFHASLCVNYSTGYTFVYPQEGGYIFTSAPQNIMLLSAACAAGNLIGINVYDQFGDWNQLFAYSHK